MYFKYVLEKIGDGASKNNLKNKEQNRQAEVNFWGKSGYS